MMNILVCRDTSDAVALYLPQRLYLKPFAKLNISVQLPTHKVHGKSISNWELMEKLRKMILPDSFSILKVAKHSTEVIRFDAEVEQRDRLDRVLARLEGRIIQLNNYPDPMKVKVTEAKLDFPSRHSWDSFFRDATDMDEMKPGERPDTVHITNLPISWFRHVMDHDDESPPSESIVKKVFEKFGNIRQVDVPAADPFRIQMKSAMRGISIPPQDQALYFEAYIQFSEYVGFVRCMDALRGKKLLHKNEDLAEWCSIRVDFDKTKHMTDAAVKRRAIVRERLLSRQRVKEEEHRQEKDKQAKREAREREKVERGEREKLEKMREREERRKKKQLAKLMVREDVDLNSKVIEEQRRLLRAQKKLQAIRLIEELFKRIELRPELQRNGKRAEVYYSGDEQSARARVVERYKRQQEDAVEAQRAQLKNAFEGRIVIRSALETKKPTRERRASSISSISSEGDRSRERARARARARDYKRIKTEKLTTPEREMEYNKATTAGMFGMPPSPFGFGYAPYAAVPPPGYPFTPQTSMYYPVRGQYYTTPTEPYGPFRGRSRGRGRGRGRGGYRMPFFVGPDATDQYYKYFKRLHEQHNEHEDRSSRSRSRSHRRSYTRSRSRSRRRSYSRSRSRSRPRRSRSRHRSRTRSRSRRSRSRSRRSRSHHTRSRSRSRKRSRTRSRSRRSKSRSRSKHHTPREQCARAASVDSSKFVSPGKLRKERSKSWSLPKEGERHWSKSPKDK